ncbi:hypothetical protein VTN77DRAFT_5081 [Rasamsonia byssochlamydoides]|uniref:uncharacterized protein n=1 Tax=Rasamsonia byssochlamydoides TaxID=89139 RepID=UPI0037426667
MAEPRRHWNGSVGDRHEHQNVWLRGGVRGPAVTSPWAGWDADRRRNSQTSTSSVSSRRSSSSSTLFTTLTNQKRNSADSSLAARRKSYIEQGPRPTGIFANWWHGYTRGEY